MSSSWYHKVSADWLEARKGVLTATDIKGMVPEMKRLAKLRAKNPDVISPGFAALWCAKHTDSILDTESRGAAARGHIMEPYAVDDWNKQRSDRFFHWDDCIVCNGVVGFSPDATNIQQPLADIRMDVKDGMLTDSSKGLFPAPTRIMEIKSYGPEHHMKACLEDAMEHDELVQVAVAFHVLPMLEKAELLFYCPGAPLSMRVFEYDRKMLEGKIRMVEDIVREYERTCDAMGCMAAELNAFHTEQEIWSDQLAAQSDGMFVLKR